MKRETIFCEQKTKKIKQNKGNMHTKHICKKAKTNKQRKENHFAETQTSKTHNLFSFHFSMVNFIHTFFKCVFFLTLTLGFTPNTCPFILDSFSVFSVCVPLFVCLFVCLFFFFTVCLHNDIQLKQTKRNHRFLHYTL